MDQNVVVTTLPPTLDLASFPIGKEGVWEWIASVSQGRHARLELAARAPGHESLKKLSEVFAHLSRVCALAAAGGRALTGEVDLARAIRDPLFAAAREGFARACLEQACAVLWDVRESPSLELSRPGALDPYGICPVCSARYPVARSRKVAEQVLTTPQPGSVEPVASPASEERIQNAVAALGDAIDSTRDAITSVRAAIAEAPQRSLEELAASEKTLTGEDASRLREAIAAEAAKVASVGLTLRQVLDPTIVNGHVRDERFWNERELFWCTVCRGAEADLTTDCPGRLTSEHERGRVTAATLDYRAGAWVELCAICHKPLVEADRRELEAREIVCYGCWAKLPAGPNVRKRMPSAAARVVTDAARAVGKREELPFAPPPEPAPLPPPYPPIVQKKIEGMW